MLKKAFFKCFIFILTFNTIHAQSLVNYSKLNSIITIGNKVLILEDKTNKLSINEAIQSKLFVPSTNAVPNFQISKSAFWIKFEIKNSTPLNTLLLELPYPTIDSVTLISYSNKRYLIENTGEYIPSYLRPFPHQYYIFDLALSPNTTKVFFIKIKASEQIQLPLFVGSEKDILRSLNSTDIYFGLYAGIIISMLFYNLFLYFIVKDHAYLLYACYILFVGLTQACIQGYTQRLFSLRSSYLPNLFMVIIPALSGISGLLFGKNYLLVKKYARKLITFLNLIIIVYIVIIILGLFDRYQLANSIMQANAGIASIFGLILGYTSLKNGYKPALFFLIAWSIFLFSVIIYVLKNLNVLPYNNFTLYALQIGSALEVILLSFALADKINIYKKEKEISQAETLKALQETARITNEQNIILEAKVIERTVELQTSNQELNKTLVDLKEAESQLVEAEKMASLGQLTAGIAHEINNPINFVTSNVAPLKRDVDMLIDAITTIEEVGLSEDSTEEKQNRIEEYKEDIDFDYLKIEIGHLLKGIHEGASRTAEIVKGLRVFSRLDEDDLKKADINEGIESTLVIANNLLNNKIKLVKQYGDIPFVECYPGKLNQVFLNIISNAIYAIKKKYEDTLGGVLKITTCCDEKNVYIKIEDNGIGMDEVTKKKIFEPFFTTKPVGEGTGLGMSITYNTIKKHNGQININSTLGIGTEFVIELQLQAE